MQSQKDEGVWNLVLKIWNPRAASCHLMPGRSDQVCLSSLLMSEGSSEPIEDTVLLWPDPGRLPTVSVEKWTLSNSLHWPSKTLGNLSLLRAA